MAKHYPELQQRKILHPTPCLRPLRLQMSLPPLSLVRLVPSAPSCRAFNPRTTVFVVMAKVIASSAEERIPHTRKNYAVLSSFHSEIHELLYGLPRRGRCLQRLKNTTGLRGVAGALLDASTETLKKSSKAAFASGMVTHTMVPISNASESPWKNRVLLFSVCPFSRMRK